MRSRMIRRSDLLAVLLAAGCASPAVRGGATASPARVPLEKRSARYRAVDCRDSAGKPFAHRSEISVGTDAEGARVLIHSVPGYDALVVRNAFRDRGEEVHQAIVGGGDGRPVLMDYRLGASGDGRMAAARRFAELEAPASSLRARVVSPSFACRLEPEAAP